MSRFDAPTAPLTTGALIGGATISGAVVAGFQAYRRAQLDRWAGLTIEQLICFLDCSEEMRNGANRRADEAEARVRELERQIADRDFVFKRDQARALRARR